MTTREKTYQRDLTWQLWHREWAGIHIGENARRQLDMADVDWQEYCGSSEHTYSNACWQTICLIETTNAWDLDKTAAATLSTARMAGLPMAIVWLKKTGYPGQVASFRVRVLWPDRWPESSSPRTRWPNGSYPSTRRIVVSVEVRMHSQASAGSATFQRSRCRNDPRLPSPRPQRL